MDILRSASPLPSARREGIEGSFPLLSPPVAGSFHPFPLVGEGWDGGTRLIVCPPSSILPRQGGGDMGNA